MTHKAPEKNDKKKKKLVKKLISIYFNPIKMRKRKKRAHMHKNVYKTIFFSFILVNFHRQKNDSKKKTPKKGWDVRLCAMQ